jgi:hypothetical protein
MILYSEIRGLGKKKSWHLIQAEAHKRAIVRTFFFPGNIRSRLEECLRRDGGHLKDDFFKK